eukprot:TRINITY_DN9120_c0_g1_i1.p1 TRINITY_DN9120_c0_g1~~TRINITY_DN9120_c0_g1_i1.p1  ORF type:complete len:247 (+),score=65.33 TRINITY_DN9120_c0_g1_i1:74-742(+)
MAERRMAAHQHTLKIIENILTRKQVEREKAVDKGMDMLGSKERRGWSVREERQNLLRERKELHDKRERDSGVRLSELAEQKQQKYNELHMKRGNRQKTAVHVRSLVREMAQQHGKEGKARRGTVMRRRQQLMLAADSAASALSEKVAEKCIDQYELEQSHREPRVEVAPFQGRPARHIPRRPHSRPPSACNILHPARPTAPTAERSTAAPSRPTFYSFRMLF